MSDKKEKKIKITEAKGRPMLNWVGKKPLDYVKGFPAQLVEVFNPSGKATPIETLTFDKIKDNWQNLLFHGDNKEVLAFLLENGFRGKIDLIYIDPPFDSGANYIRKVELRGTKEKAKLEGEDYTLGEQIQYHDIWANDSYLQWMYERLLLLKELLSEKGFILLHCDYHRGHYLKIIMDEIYGHENFRNEIVVKRVQKNFVEGEYIKSMNNAFDTVLLYSKSTESKFLPPRDHETTNNDEEENWHGFDAPNWSGGRPNLYYELFGTYPPPGNVWRWTKERAMQSIKEGTLRKNPKTGNPEYLVENDKGAMVNNLWADILAYSYKEDYPTEKSEKLLSRIVEICSKPDSLVMDCFMGSGTTQAVAQNMGRRWIGVDINKGSIQTTSKRLQRIISEQYESHIKESKQKKLKKSDDVPPQYFSFIHYKVNDYDLQLLRTEAIELAIQHIGIQRTKTDTFFEGMLGKNLVKMIDFNHPLTLLDIQLIQDELKKRPDENRNITVVCLGKELAVDPYIEDYNKKHPVNKLEVIELRTDKKYGKFLIHKPSEAKVDIKRKDDKVIVEIKGFLSPSIIERLNDPDRLVKVKIPDYKSMIDYVLIDSDYNGKVFNITYSDVPEKKTDMVGGKYELDVSAKKRKVAVKIVDMLGEEVLIVREV